MNYALCIDKLDLNKDARVQKDLLQEDLLQVEFSDRGFVLDLGWFPAYDIHGRFVLNVIKDGDWEAPVLKMEFIETRDLEINLNKAIDFCTK